MTWLSFWSERQPRAGPGSCLEEPGGATSVGQLGAAAGELELQAERVFLDALHGGPAVSGAPESSCNRSPSPSGGFRLPRSTDHPAMAAASGAGA